MHEIIVAVACVEGGNLYDVYQRARALNVRVRTLPTLLELVNGKNTVKEIVRQSRMGSFEVSKMLYRLLSIKLIRKRVPVVAV